MPSANGDVASILAKFSQVVTTKYVAEGVEVPLEFARAVLGPAC